MKLTANRKALVAAIKATVVPTGTARLEVLAGIHISADKKTGVTLTSTNVDLTITGDVAADVEKNGTAIVYADRLVKFLSTGGADTATIAVDAGQVEISCGTSVLTLRSLPIEAWPKCTLADGESLFLTSQDVARIGRILYAAKMDRKDQANRPALYSVHFNGNRVECTDSYRLAVASVSVDLPDVLVPVDVMQRVVKSVASTDAEGVTVVCDGHQVTFGTDTTSWTARLIPLDYPKIDTFLGMTPPHKVRLTTGDLIDALDRVSVVDGDLRTVKLLPGDGSVTVASSTMDVGEASDVVSCTGEFGVDKISFKSPLLRELLTAHDEETVTLELTDSLKATQVRSSDSKLVHILMPVRTQ